MEVEDKELVLQGFSLKPKFIVADEPVSALDVYTGSNIKSYGIYKRNLI